MVSNTNSPSPNVPIKYKRRSIRANRDFPEGCGPSKTVPKVLQDSDDSDMLATFTLHDVKVEEEPNKSIVLTTVEFGGIGLPPKDNDTLDHETTKLLDLAKTLCKSYPSRRKTSAIRSFPPGCGTSAIPDSMEEEGLTTFDFVGIGLPPKDNDTLDHETTNLLDLAKTLCKSYPSQRKTSAIRSFPPGCGTSAIPDSIEEEGLTTFDFVGIGLPNAIDTLDHENTKLSKKDVEDCKFYPPRERAIFQSIQSCSGTKAPQINSKDNCVIAIDASESNNSSNKSATALNVQKEVERSNGKEDRVVSTFKSNPYQSELKSQESECSNMIGVKDKSLENGRVGKLQENVSAGLELAGHRITVQALMAAPKCPWTNKVRRKRTPK
uniref:Uncharacterized protein n=1 Tax=Fagus sylvatica TaxID=28930 RepID=A0A2N9EQC0_FAGSY